MLYKESTMKKTFNIQFVLIIFVILNLTLSCSYPTQPEPGTIIRGELIIGLVYDVIDQDFEDFVSDYSMYQFRHVKDLMPSINIHLFRFNYRLINQHVFRDMIRNDERVRHATFNTYIGFDY